MNSKMLFYMMTKNPLFLFMPVKTALIMSMMGMGGSLFGTQTASGAIGGMDMNSIAPLLLVSGGLNGGSRRRSYRRYNRPIIVRNYRR